MSLDTYFARKSQAEREAELKYLATGNRESIVDLREIAIMLLADATASEVENQEGTPNFYHLHDDFVRSGEDICETFRATVLDEGIDIEREILGAQVLALKIIKSIDANLKDFTFEEMYETSEADAHREICRGIGHGLSFWDDNDYQDFGFLEMPKIGYFEPCHAEAYSVLTKLVAHREQNG